MIRLPLSSLLRHQQHLIHNPLQPLHPFISYLVMHHQPPPKRLHVMLLRNLHKLPIAHP